MKWGIIYGAYAFSAIKLYAFSPKFEKLIIDVGEV